MRLSVPCSFTPRSWVSGATPSLPTRLTAGMQVAQRVSALAQGQDNPAFRMGACRALKSTFYFMGAFEAARQQAACGVELWRPERYGPRLNRWTRR